MNDAEQVSVSDFNKYCQSVDDMLNVIQLIIDEELQHNTIQDSTIVDIQLQLVELNAQVTSLSDKIDEFKLHMDNGWRLDFIDMFNEHLKYMSKELLDMLIEQSKQLNVAVIDELKAVYNSVMSVNEKKIDKHTIDWNLILIGLLGAGGIIYIVLSLY